MTNITQSARKVVFCGTFTTKGLRCSIGGGELKILSEGKVKKLVPEVDQITFSGDYARSLGQKVLYLTERAVFELTSEGVVLREIAPGVELERDILKQMEFEPIVAEDLAMMDSTLFKE